MVAQKRGPRGGPWLTTRDVGEKLGVDPKTVVRYAKAGQLQGRRLGGGHYRFTEDAVAAFLERADPAAAGSSDREAWQAHRVQGRRVTAIVSQKGGVGKTTTTHNLGAALAERGRRVLLIDLDPQASLSLACGIALDRIAGSIYDVLVSDDGDPNAYIVRTDLGIDILPATIDLAAAEFDLFSEVSRETILRAAIDRLAIAYDDILIDCPPSLGLLTINALSAADAVIVPVVCDFLSTRGVRLLLRSVSKIQARVNRRLKIAGFLPTLYVDRSMHQREVLDELRAAFPDEVFDTVIRSAAKVRESPAASLPILAYDARHPVAMAYRKLAERYDHAR